MMADHQTIPPPPPLSTGHVWFWDTITTTITNTTTIAQNANASSPPSPPAPPSSPGGELHEEDDGGGCLTVVFSQMPFIPWDNPDNIVSVQTEDAVRQVKNNMIVLLFLIGGPANVINMAVFRRQGLGDRVNLCLFALALADELYLVTAMLHFGEQLHIQFTTRERFGPLTSALTNGNSLLLFGFGFVSPVLSAILATERCLCVYSPLRFHRLLSTRAMAVIIGAVYVLTLGLFSLVAFRYRIGCVYDPTTGVRVTTTVEGKFYRSHKELIDRLDSFVFGIGLSGLVLTVVIVATVMTTVKLRQAAKWRSVGSAGSATISPKEVALTRMLVGNSLLFLACISFKTLNRFTWLFFPEISAGRRQHNFFLTGLWLADFCTAVNSSLNIFVYYTMGSRYRQTFWTLLHPLLSCCSSCCCCCSRSKSKPELKARVSGLHVPQCADRRDVDSSTRQKV